MIQIECIVSSTKNFLCFFKHLTFNNTKFIGPADFNSGYFLGFADFGGSQFGDGADFSNSSFGGPADFSRSNIGGIFNLRDAQFDKNVYFESSRVNAIDLSKTRYEWLFLHWNSINRLEFDEAAYKMLINNYKRLQWQQDSNDCSSSYIGPIQTESANGPSWIINAVGSIFSGANSGDKSYANQSRK